MTDFEKQIEQLKEELNEAREAALYCFQRLSGAYWPAAKQRYPWLKYVEELAP